MIITHTDTDTPSDYRKFTNCDKTFIADPLYIATIQLQQQALDEEMEKLKNQLGETKKLKDSAIRHNQVEAMKGAMKEIRRLQKEVEFTITPLTQRTTGTYGGGHDPNVQVRDAMAKFKLSLGWMGTDHFEVWV